MAGCISEPTDITSDLQKTPEAHSDRLIRIIGNLSHLRADIREKKITNPMKISGQAKSILDELLKWDADGQRFYGSARTPLMSEFITPGYDTSAFHIMNQYRSARLSINWILPTYSSSILL